jgi:hypothetical protein
MPRLGNKHFKYNAKGYAAYRKAKKGMVKDAVRKNPINRTEVSPSARRQNIRANAQGKSASQLRAKAQKGGDFRARVLARVLQNRSLKKDNKNWRKEAGGGKGLFKDLKEAKANFTPAEGPRAERGATQLAKVQARVKSFKANRREMLKPDHAQFKKKRKKPTSPSPTPDGSDD